MTWDLIVKDASGPRLVETVPDLMRYLDNIGLTLDDFFETKAALAAPDVLLPELTRYLLHPQLKAPPAPDDKALDDLEALVAPFEKRMEQWARGLFAAQEREVLRLVGVAEKSIQKFNPNHDEHGRFAPSPSSSNDDVFNRFPGHLIAEKDVPEFLRGSYYTGLSKHQTSIRGAKEIMSKGVDIEKNVNGACGQGFYTDTHPGKNEYGDHTVTVAIRLQKPLHAGNDSKEHFENGALLADIQMASKFNPRETRRRILDMGYDGVILSRNNEGGIGWVIAMKNESVRVVV